MPFASVLDVSFARLARGCRNAFEKRWHALIRSYSDDSGDDRGERYVSTGGIIGSEELVDVFEGLWIEETKHLKEPFRAVECECQHEQFKNWSKPDCDALMARLVDVICHAGNLVGAYASVVPIPLYRDIFPGSADSDPYKLTVAHIIFEMARSAKRYDLLPEI
jgi:hypothetical protein